MTLRQLECFVLIAKNMSFKAAADTLYISPSAVTQQINNLESELGIKLLNRDSRHFELTPAGQVFYEGITDALDKITNTAEAAQATAKEISQTIVIGYIGLSAAKILSKATKSFHNLFPFHKIQLLPCDPVEIPSLLRLKSIDLAFLAKSYLPNEEDLLFENLISYNYGLVMFHLHPLAGEKVITKKHIQTYKLVLPQNQYLSQTLIKKLTDCYGTDNIIMVESQSELLLEIRTHNCIGIMPEYLYLSRHDIVSKALDFFDNDEYGFVRLAGNNSVWLNSFIDCLHNMHLTKASLIITSPMDIFN